VATEPIQKLFSWVGLLVRDLPAQLQLYSPRPAIDRGLRERIMLAAGDKGSRYSRWVHSGWAELTDRGDEARYEIAVAYARDAALAGRVPPSEEARQDLEAAFSSAEVRSIDAAIAQVQVLDFTGATFEDLMARLAGAGERDLATMITEAAVVTAAAPVGVPLLALGALLRQTARSVPPVEIATPSDANLMVAMLGEMARRYSGLPLLRALGAGRVTFAVALQSGSMEATIRFRHSRLELENGIASDVVLTVRGEPEALLAAMSGQESLLSLVNKGKLTVGS
jgi:hypothetical protein